jgi:tetratricopeptide (TPR) repeat protein
MHHFIISANFLFINFTAMRNSFIIILLAVGSLAFIKVEQSRVNAEKTKAAIAAYRSKYTIGCSPNLDTIDFSDSSNSIPLLKGWGSYRMAVTVKNDSANIYFQQGINMYYGFHIIEALASFEKALQFDENFAMGYWGKALAYGPNINDMGYAASPEALASVKKATALYSNCTSLEKAFINAMSIRYSADSTQSREQLNQLYANAMKQLYAAFPNSADAGTLYADALMVQHPWDLYDRNYNPKPWTAQIVQVLEQVVKRFPNNPGAGHYYIHAVEGSSNPQKGLAIANRLGAMMPGLSHLVHMPSHIYIRSGHYSKGIAVNKLAVKDYYSYLDKYPAVVNSAGLYLIHNQHLEIACSMMDGQYNNAMKTATALNKKIDSSMLDAGGYFGVFSQYVYLTPQFVLLRFGKWDELLSMPAAAPSQVYASILSHFARGIAFARTHQLNDAAKELQQLQAATPSPQLTESPPAFNPGIAGSLVAEKILQGVIAEEKNDLPTAILLLKDAIDKEDGMLYGEPRDWLLPARNYLVNVLLKTRQYKEAEKVCRADIFINPNNPWSLISLEKALEKQGKIKDANAIHSQVIKAIARADVKIAAAAF